MSHTAFHSSVYLLALGAVADENVAATWRYVRSRINPPFETTSPSQPSAGPHTPPPPSSPSSPSSESSPPQAGQRPLRADSKDDSDGATGTEAKLWPPPPPPGARDGMPCGTYVSQFVLQALYVGSVAVKGDMGEASLNP